GKNALDLLFRHAALPADTVAIMASALQASIGENAIAMELNRDCLIGQVRLRQNDRERILELDWNAIQNQECITEKVLVTVRDVTEIHEYQQAMQGHR